MLHGRISLAASAALFTVGALAAPAHAAPKAPPSASALESAGIAALRNGSATSRVHPDVAIAEPTLTVHDPSGDNAGAADIVAAGYHGDGSTVTFAVRVASPVDPSTDPLWQTHKMVLAIAIDPEFTGRPRLIALATIGRNHQLATLIAGISLDLGIELCPGTAQWLANQDYAVSYPRACLAGIGQFQWAAAMGYEPDVSQPDVEDADIAPDHSYVGPVRVHEGAPLAGYWMLGTDGDVYSFGDGVQSLENEFAGHPFASAISPRRDGTGYWVVDRAGHVFTTGRSKYFGGHPTLRAGEYVTTIASTPSANGYWLFSNFGRVFAYGDAHNYGDMSARRLHAPVIASVSTASGHGYYMVGGDGGIFTFGDAVFHGSTGALRLHRPIVGISPTPDGKGYWLVGDDGGVFAFNAPFRGSMGARRLAQPVDGLIAFGNGYLMVAGDGGVFDFSNKPFVGSLGGEVLSARIIGIVAFSL